MAEAASGAAIDPLKESGAMTTMGVDARMRGGYSALEDYGGESRAIMLSARLARG
jgi:hypothetical protein